MRPAFTPQQTCESIPPWLMSADISPWEDILAEGTPIQWSRKTNIYTFDDAANEIILLRRGLVKIVATGINGVLRNIGILGPGSIVGEAAFFHEKKYKHIITCVEDSEGCVFKKTTIEKRILATPRLALYLMQNLAGKSYLMSTQLECASFMSSQQIIANYLFHLGKEQEKGSWIYTKMSPLPLTIIAELLGLHRVTVTKIINNLKKDGIISTQNRLVIEAPETLLAIMRQ